MFVFFRVSNHGAKLFYFVFEVPWKKAWIWPAWQASSETRCSATCWLGCSGVAPSEPGALSPLLFLFFCGNRVALVCLQPLQLRVGFVLTLLVAASSRVGAVYYAFVALGICTSSCSIGGHRAAEYVLIFSQVWMLDLPSLYHERFADVLQDLFTETVLPHFRTRIHFRLV